MTTTSPSTTPEANAIRQKLWRERHKHETSYKENRAKRSRERHINIRDSEEYRKRFSDWMANYRKTHHNCRVVNDNWYKNNIEKVRAQGILRNAVYSGRIVRPKRCTKCHINPGLARNGAVLLHAHHTDYSKPLDVTWLCAFCHGNERRKY